VIRALTPRRVQTVLHQGMGFASILTKNQETDGNLSVLSPIPASRAAACLLVLMLSATAVCARAQSEQATIGPQSIVRMVEEHLLRNLADAPMTRGASRVEVSAGALDSRLRLAACDTPIRIRADLSREASRVNARVSCGAPTPWAIYVPAQIRVYRPVVVANRALSRGETVAPNDVMLEERDILSPGAPPLLRLEDAIGLSARRAIPANSVLSTSVVEQPVLVHRGDRVSVTSRAGTIAVRTTGEALADGRSGERIRVRNLQSEKIIEATVTGPGTVEVI